MPQNIIVTGVNGFVGEHVVDSFNNDSFAVIGLAYNPEPNNKVAGKLASYQPCNLLDESAVETVSLDNVHAIIHLAGLSAVGESFEQPHRYITENALMTYNLLSYAHNNQFKGRIVVVSTGALYASSQPLPLSEQSATSPSSPYAIGKLSTEHVVSYFSNRGLDAISVRPFNHIGPGQGEGFILPDLYKQLQSANETGEMLVGNIKTKRDYTDVRDVASAYKALALAKSLSHQLYNICSGHSVSGIEMLDLLQKEVGLNNVNVVIDPSKIRPTDVMDIYGDASRLHSELGWEPKIPLQKTIQDFVKSNQ